MHTKYIPRLAVLSLTLLFGACHSTPKHARYIPKDATAVIAINTGGISKEVAWSKITGSKILDDMEKSAKDPKSIKEAEGLKDIEHSGIDFMSTLYLYLKADTRFSGSQRFTAVLPLKDKAQWETWVKKMWPDANIHAAGNRNEALLDGKMYAGWDGETVMIMNTAMQQETRTAPMASADSVAAATDTMAIAAPPYNDYTEKVNEPATAAEMDLAFKLPKEASIMEDAHFKALAAEGHDVSYFLNYDAAMNSTSALATGGMGMSMGATLWKGTAMTGGFDFEKGSVEGMMRYYTSDSLKEIAKAFGSDNLDGSMAARLPGQGLNMAAGYHLSPKAVKLIMDKMGYTGLANMYLGSQGFSVDNILSAFSGDMVFSVNNFTMVKEMRGTDSISKAYGMTPYPSATPKLDYLFAMKIGDKAAFDKLFTFVNAQAEGMLVQSAPNTYTLAKAANSNNPMVDNLTLIISDKYFAVGNNPASVQAFLKGNGSAPDAAKKELSGHPVGFYADVQGMMQAGAATISSPSDSTAYAEVKKLFADAAINGGEYKNGANEYHMSLRMTDKSENSLLQLLQFVQHMSAIKNNATAASNPAI